MKHKFAMRFFKCSDCGTIRTAPKTYRKGLTEIGHIKDMFCCVCKAEKKFVQVNEAEV